MNDTLGPGRVAFSTLRPARGKRDPSFAAGLNTGIPRRLGALPALFEVDR